MREDVRLLSCLRGDGDAEGSSEAPVKTDLTREGFVQAVWIGASVDGSLSTSA